jgi:hypothetical protein
MNVEIVPCSVKRVEKLISSRTRHFNLTKWLHTDVLEDEYGPIRICLLHHDQQFRVVHLVDREDISRTFAITVFPTEGHSSSIAEVNRKIKNGEPLGRAFRDSGYEVRKNVLKVLIIKQPEWLTAAFRDQKTYAKARISEFLARKVSEQVEFYGTILEVYPSSFRPSAISTIDKLQEASTVKALLRHGFQLNEIWTCLANAQLRHRQDARYIKALRESQQDILNFTQKAHKVLSRNWSLSNDSIDYSAPPSYAITTQFNELRSYQEFSHV